MKKLVGRFLREDKGQDLIEYALIGTVVSLGAFAGAQFLGQALNGWYNKVGNAVNNVSVPAL